MAPLRLPARSAVSPQPYTRLAFEGLEFAKDRGTGSEYNGRIMRAFFQESRDIGDPDVPAQLASEVGLDADEFRRALTGLQSKEALEAAIEDARSAEPAS